MNEKTINIIGVISGIIFGVISTWAVLKPDEHLRLYKAQTLLSYQDQSAEILAISDPESRREKLIEFKGRIQFFRNQTDPEAMVFFENLKKYIEQAELQVAELQDAEDEADRQRLVAEQQANETDRLRQEEADRRAAQVRLEQVLIRERICLNNNCSQWILP